MRAWVLNLDADHELAHPEGYSPRRDVSARVATLAARIEGLVPPGDVRIDLVSDASGFNGRAWCPTPRALQLLEESGATLPPFPPLEVLRRVNHRAFCAELGQTLDGAAFLRDAHAVEQRIASGSWLLKRPHGFAGSGRRRVKRLDDDTNRWITASLRVDGLQVEPWCERTADFSMHGFIAPDGKVTLGEACLQECDARGQWLRARRARSGELLDHERSVLQSEAERSAEALHRAGYFGPFGIDAYRYQGGFNPRSEINARYTMAWAIGMGTARPDLGA